MTDKVGDIDSFLADLGLSDCLDMFRDNHIDLDVVGELDEADLKEIGLSLGQRKKVLKAVRELKEMASQEPKIVKPAKALARARLNSDAERRQLTVVFCDMVGSTSLAARLDPEEMFEVISTYQRSCTDVIERFNGHVAKFLGDGVLAYFGYPSAREDDAERAVAASLELISTVNRLKVSSVDRLEARVGIDTGLVVIGELLGGGHAEEDAIVGDTPNLAARLQGVARPSSVVMSANSRRLLAGLFEYRDLGHHDLKGFGKPIRAFEVVGLGSAETRFDARKSLGVTPLVGRSQELDLLNERWRTARSGEGQVVCLVGEGGVGKSRMVSELRDRLARTPHRVLSYICAEFHQGTAYYPVIRQIERSAGLTREDPDTLKMAKIARLLESAGIKEPIASATFGWYIGLKTTGIEPALELSPEDRKGVLFSTLIDLLERMSAKIPLLVLFEDLHWVDPSSVELLTHVIQKIKSRKILVLCTFRPEFHPDWGREPHVTLLQLNRLGRNLGTLLVDRVTGGRALPPEVLENILDRTDGVPLFVEEFTKNLIEGGILEEDGDRYRLVGPMRGMAIPATLQDSLAARLDRLSAAKDVAQWAAALGRHFSEQLLLAVVPRDASDVKPAIAALLDSQIIYRRGLPPRETYEFKHALLQEAAYAGMVRSRRAQLHTRIAGIISDQFPDIAELEPETMARHFEAAGMLLEAIPPLLQGGDMASEKYARKEARAQYDAALKLARKLERSDTTIRLEVKSILKRCTVALGRDQVDEDLVDLRLARTLAEGTNNRPRLAQIAYWIGRSHYVSGNFDKAATRAAEVLEFANGDEKCAEVQAAAVNLLARIECLRGRPKAAMDHASRNIEQMKALDDKIEIAAMHGVLAFGQALAGEFEDAIATAQNGAALSDEIGHLPTQAACHFFKGLVLGWHGDLDPALDAFDAAHNYAEQAHDVFRIYLIHGWRGEVRYLCGDHEAARADLEQCQSDAAQLGSNYQLPAFKSFYARLLADDGNLDEAQTVIDDCVREASTNRQDWSRSIALRHQAEITSISGNLDQALAMVDEALGLHERDGVVTDRAHAMITKAQILAKQGDQEGSNACFARALDHFQRMGMPNAVAETRTVWAKHHQNNDKLTENGERTQSKEQRA